MTQGLRAKKDRKVKRPAEDDVLDQSLFVLDARAHKKFLAMLDKPAKPSGALLDRMKRNTFGTLPCAMPMMRRYVPSTAFP